jgi:hypothetical protein
MKHLLFAGCCAFLCACSVTKPAAVFDGDREIMRGNATGSMSGGLFKVSGQGATCSGSYDPLTKARTLTLAVTCDDGRKGILTMNRNPDLVSGDGAVRMSDGKIYRVAFGDRV